MMLFSFGVLFAVVSLNVYSGKEKHCLTAVGFKLATFGFLNEFFPNSFASSWFEHYTSQQKLSAFVYI